jgi:hypothetical protein
VDASGSYLLSTEAAANIARFAPEARIVAIVREPVAFLRSYHLQLLRNPRSEGERVRSLERAMALEDERRRGRHLPRGCEVPELLWYRERVRYRDQLARFEDHFPPDQRLWLVYDDFATDNEGVARQVLRFLGLDDHAALHPARVNVGGRVRSRAGQRLVHDVTTGRGGMVTRTAGRLLKATLPPERRRRLARSVNRRVLFGPPPELRPEFVRDLRERLRPEVVALSEHLDRDLVSRWGYADA